MGLGRKDGRKDRRKNKRLALILTVFLLAGTLSGCSALGVIAAELMGISTGREQREITEALGVNVSGGSIILSEDSHGGFHGDGMTFIVLSFDEEEAGGLKAQMEGRQGWHPLPLSENAGILVYGYDTEEMQTGPYLCDEQGQGVIPQIQNGYYYFYDRQSESTDAYDDTDVFDRGSYNFTLAVYDSDMDMLYYVEFDT